MATTARPITILNAVAGLIQAIDGTGDYNHDLTASGAVVRSPRLPGMSPCVGIYLPQGDTAWHSLTAYDATMIVYVDFRIEPAGRAYSVVEDALLNLESDIRRAVNVTALNNVAAMLARPLEVNRLEFRQSHRHGDPNSEAMPNGRMVLELSYRTLNLTDGL
jgi:hypothetical protein